MLIRSEPLLNGTNLFGLLRTEVCPRPWIAPGNPTVDASGRFVVARAISCQRQQRPLAPPPLPSATTRFGCKSTSHPCRAQSRSLRRHSFRSIPRFRSDCSGRSSSGNPIADSAPSLSRTWAANRSPGLPCCGSETARSRSNQHPRPP